MWLVLLIASVMAMGGAVNSSQVSDIEAYTWCLSRTSNNSRVCRGLMRTVLSSQNVTEVYNMTAPSHHPTSAEVWKYGLLSVTVISLCSIFGLVLKPVMKTQAYNSVLVVLIGLAVGSLSSSAIFQLIPEAFEITESENRKGYLHISLAIWFGIWTFYMVDKVLQVHETQKNKSKKKQDDGTLMESLTKNGSNSTSTAQQLLLTNTDCKHVSTKPLMITSGVDVATLNGNQKYFTTDNHDDQNSVPKVKNHTHIAPVAWMVVLGDAVHNFIDGVSIGAAFCIDLWTGFGISVAVLCEELPHELGDFAVLLDSGMAVKQAVMYNFLSACTCYLGFIVGVLLGEIEIGKYIFGFAAGMFLYISLVGMMVEMNEKATNAAQEGWKKGFQVLILQQIGIVTGLACLYSLARYQLDTNDL